MQIKKLSAACAVALAGMSAPAFALAPFDTPDLTIFLSGATAPDNFLEQIATGMFNGTVKNTDYFKYVDNGDGKQQRAFFGTMKTTAVDPTIPAALSGKKVLFIKRSTGGSVFGVNPVARAEGLAVLKIATPGCVLTAGDYLCPVVGVDSGTGTPTGAEVVADFGVSDVGPALFKEPLNVEFGKTQLSPSEVAGMTVKPVNVLAMGYAVTNTIPDSTYFSKATYGAMLSGNLVEWTKAGAAAAPAAGDQVVVCRRVPGSGTQTSYNWFFNNFPCATDSIAGSGNTQPTRMSDSASGVVSGTGTSADPYVIDPTAGYTVIENSTSGNVRDCLNKAANGGTHTFKDEEGKSYSVNFGSGGYGAIGVLSVDSLTANSSATPSPLIGATDPATAAGFSFRAADGAGAMWDAAPASSTVTVATSGSGVHPTKQNLIDGKYEFAVELTMQYRNDLAATKKTFADFFIARAGSPSFNTNAWVAALPPVYDPTTTANVAKGTHFGNMCAPLQRLF
jgi:hypothetical protein